MYVFTVAEHLQFFITCVRQSAHTGSVFLLLETNPVSIRLQYGNGHLVVVQQCNKLPLIARQDETRRRPRALTHKPRREKHTPINQEDLF